MHSTQSHGRLIGIFAILSLAVFTGFGGGFWISERLGSLREQTWEEKRLQNVSVSAQLLRDMILYEIENLRVLATSGPQQLNSNLILHWADLEFQGDQIQKVRQSYRSPSWVASSEIEKNYIATAIRTIKPKEVLENKMALIRVKQDSVSGREWLGFAFQSTRSASSIVLALIDPSQGFHAFQKWMAHSAGGKSRSYLLGGDGRVLAHSQKSFDSADFSETPFFKAVMQKALSGMALGGKGETLGIDQMPVDTAYYRVGRLPLAVVVEEIRPTTGFNMVRLTDISGSLLITMVFLMTFIMTCSLILKTYLVKVVTLTVRSNAEENSPVKTSSQGFISSQDMLILNQVKVEPNNDS